MPEANDVKPRSPDWWLLLFSAGLGLLLGLALPQWQWAVEHAQVLAGIVRYPAESPVAIAHAKLWSLVPQIGALLLAAGVSERALSHLLSGVLGAISFSALTAVVLALRRDAILALGAPVLVFVSRAAEYGVTYPIWLLDTPHTYGVAGLSWSALAWGLCALGWARSGLVLLALALAVHPAIGVFALATAALAVVPDRELARRLGSQWRWLALGVMVTGVSFAVHLASMPALPAIADADATRYLRAFAEVWDSHRQPVSFYASGVKLTMATVVLAAVWLATRRGAMPGPRAWLLRAVVIAGVLSLALAAWTRLPARFMPDAVLAAMPGRLLNLNIFLVAALVIGLAGSLPRARVAAALVVALAAALLLSGRSLFWAMFDAGRPSFDPHDVLLMGTLVLVAALMATRRPGSERGGLRPDWTAAIAAVFALAAAVTIVYARDGWRPRVDELADWRTEPALEAASRGTGPLLTGGELFLIQARTRRALLLDGGTLDTLPYALESAPAVDRILRDVHGIDLFNAPAEARYGGRVPAQANRYVWERYEASRWRRIRETYGVQDVLTPSGWRLQLPRLAESPRFVLYRIP